LLSNVIKNGRLLEKDIYPSNPSVNIVNDLIKQTLKFETHNAMWMWKMKCKSRCCCR